LGDSNFGEALLWVVWVGVEGMGFSCLVQSRIPLENRYWKKFHGHSKIRISLDVGS